MIKDSMPLNESPMARMPVTNIDTAADSGMPAPSGPGLDRGDMANRVDPAIVQTISQVSDWLQTLSQEQQQMWGDLFDMWGDLIGDHPSAQQLMNMLYDSVLNSLGDPNYDWAGQFGYMFGDDTVTELGSYFGLDNITMFTYMGGITAIGWNNQTGQWEILTVGG